MKTTSIAALLLACTAASSFAAQRYVATNGANSSTCQTQASPCLTINYAVGQSSAADTINVASGTYAEAVVIGAGLDGLTLRGAQAGVDARVARGAETIIDGNALGAGNGIYLQSNGITVDGLTVTGFVTSGIYQVAANYGQKIVNNVLRGNRYTGIYMGCEGTQPCAAQFNLFDANQDAMGGGGDGIYSDSGTVNVLIDSNLFTNHINGSVVITGTQGVSMQKNITITHNRSLNDGTVIVVGADQVLIADNDLGLTANTCGIQIDSSTHATVRNNVLRDSGLYGIRVSTRFFSAPTADTVVITGNTVLNSTVGVLIANNRLDPADPANQNSIDKASAVTVECNRIVGNTTAGYRNYDSESVNIGNNWWGCNAGPGASDCDSLDGANVDPAWLTLGLSANPNPLTLGQSTLLSATLNRNSLGVLAACSVANITPISFAGSPGTISNAPATTSGGLASATFKPSASGSAAVSVTVDNQTVRLNLPVVAPLVAPLSVPALAGWELWLLALLVGGLGAAWQPLRVRQ